MDSDSPTQTLDTITLLRKAGLTESQAKGYLALIEHGQLTPTELGEKTGESRTNAYMICDKLVALGLATKNDSKKITYTPSHPSALETLAEKRRKAIQRAETELKNSINPLIELFYASSELPGTRTLQGIDGIKEVYADTLRTKQDIYLLRTAADTADLGLDYLDTLLKEHYGKKGL
jgi:sugar-specific transcriptional regulator TrmB